MSVSIDITARGCEQEALLVSEARLEAVAELAGLAFCEVYFGAGAMFLEDGRRLGAGRHALLAGDAETDEGAGEGAGLLQLGAVRRASQGLCYETPVMVVIRTGGSDSPAAPGRSTVAARATGGSEPPV